MSKLCIGCGLTTDDSGNLIAAISGTFSATTLCPADSAGKVYCNDTGDGELYVDPPSYYREFQDRFNINTGSADPTDAVFGSPDVGNGADAGIPPATNTKTYSNPSKCWPMSVYISHGIEHFLFTVTAPGGTGLKARGDVQPQSRIDVSIFDSSNVLTSSFTDVSLHQHWGGVVEDSEILRFDSMAAYFDLPNALIVPAGGKITIKQSASIYVIAKHQDGGSDPGSVRISNWSNAFKIRGWAGP